jgi:hypothetical protein
LNDPIWRYCKTRVEERTLLTILLLVDIILVAVHIWLWAQGQRYFAFNIEVDRSIPEAFNYLKWTVSAIACVYVYKHSSGFLYMIWALLFFYFLLDDANQIHEQLGSILVLIFDINSALALRGQDFGELAVSLIVGCVLLGAMLVFYLRDDNKTESKSFTKRQLPWLAVLIFCGVFVDMFHIQIGIFKSPFLGMFVGVIEDGGEMIAASFLTYFSVEQAFRIKLH